MPFTPSHVQPVSTSHVQQMPGIAWRLITVQGTDGGQKKAGNFIEETPAKGYQNRYGGI